MLLSACASNAIYRSDHISTCEFKAEPDCANSALQIYKSEKSEYHLGFVEYDDQGQLRNRDQMDAVIDKYWNIAGTSEKEGVMLIVFVHGWHHSAKSGDSNIDSFRTLLQGLSKNDLTGRKILGLYIGWRGEAVTVPLVNNLTFWERKNTAHNVGQQGVSEVLLKVEEIVNVKTAIGQDERPKNDSRLVVIGHSFGGALAYTSLQNILADRFVGSKRDKTVSNDVEGFGDLIVLMNPAFEAMRFGTLYDLSQKGCRRYFPTQLPKLAILTSETDYATKYAFAAGRYVSTLFESYVTLDRYYCREAGNKGKQEMKVNEGAAARTAVGHFAPYLTHRLNKFPPPVRPGKPAEAREPIKTKWSEHTNEVPVNFDYSELVSLKKTTPLNPYLNIQVDRNLISDHNDIWGKEIIHFVQQLIVISTTPIPSKISQSENFQKQ